MNPAQASGTCLAAVTAGRKTASSLLFKEFLWQLCTQVFQLRPAGREQADATKRSEKHAWSVGPTMASPAITGLFCSFIFLQGGNGVRDASQF